MASEMFQQVARFVRSQHTLRVKELTPETTVENDLGITGDDSHEFMLAFFEEFGVNYESFNIGKFFHGEGYRMPFVTALLWRIFNGTRIPDPPERDLTLGDLTRVAQQGEWVDPE